MTNSQLSVTELDTLHRVLYSLGIWSKIKSFLENEPNYQVPTSDDNELKKIEKTLLDSDTQAICMYLVYKFQTDDSAPLTLGSLTKILEPENAEPSTIKSAQAKVKKILERVGDRYSLISYEIVKKDRQEIYQISPTEKLLKFFKQSLIKDYEENFLIDKASKN